MCHCDLVIQIKLYLLELHRNWSTAPVFGVLLVEVVVEGCVDVVVDGNIVDVDVEDLVVAGVDWDVVEVVVEDVVVAVGWCRQQFLMNCE